MSSISFGQAATIILAESQLKAVEAVTGAIRAADLESGGVMTPMGIVEKAAPPPGGFSDINREPVYEPRRHIQRDPVYTRRQVIQPTPRYEARPVVLFSPSCEPCVPVDPCNSCAPSPVEPPWKVLPWMDRYPKPTHPQAEVVKMIVAGPDISHRGLMVDILV